MVHSRFPAGIGWPVFLLVLIGFVLVTSGCVQDSGSEKITSAPTPEPTAGIQGFVARPVASLDRSILRSTAIPVITTTNVTSFTGPTLNATGSDAAMETLQIQKETLAPV